VILNGVPQRLEATSSKCADWDSVFGKILYLAFIVIIITVLSGNSKSANRPRFPDEQIEESLLCFYRSYTPFLRLHSTALRKYGRNFRGKYLLSHALRRQDGRTGLRRCWKRFVWHHVECETRGLESFLWVYEGRSHSNEHFAEAVVPILVEIGNCSSLGFLTFSCRRSDEDHG
jgi:hypothetical protein